MKQYLIGFALLAVFVIPGIASAQIVTCGDSAANMCQLCHFIALGNNILTWIIGVMASVCAIVVAVAGFKMATAGGDTGAISSAKSMIWNVLIGFIILLSAWLIIDTVVKMLISSDGNVPGFGPWNAIQCVTQPTPSAATTPPPSGGIVVAPPASATGCAGTCTAIPTGITIKANACGGGGACTVSDQIAGNLTTMDGKLDAAGINWQVTEAYPPTRVHKEACHQNGTCIDANCIGGCTPTQAKAMYDAAASSGLRPVYEVQTQAQKDAAVAAGMSPDSVLVLGTWISAPHFSIYK